MYQLNPCFSSIYRQHLLQSRGSENNQSVTAVTLSNTETLPHFLFLEFQIKTAKISQKIMNDTWTPHECSYTKFPLTIVTPQNSITQIHKNTQLRNSNSPAQWYKVRTSTTEYTNRTDQPTLKPTVANSNHHRSLLKSIASNDNGYHRDRPNRFITKKTKQDSDRIRYREEEGGSVTDRNQGRKKSKGNRIRREER